MKTSETVDWGEMPWAFYVIILIVFAFTIPFEFNRPLALLDWSAWADSATAMERMERGNLGRRVALVALAFLALASLVRLSRKHLTVNGPLGWLIIFYITWAGFSVIWALDTTFTARRVLILVLMWFGAVGVAERYSLRQIFGLGLFVTSATIVIAIFNELRLGTIDPLNQTWRLSGMMHAIQLGWNCGLLILFAIAFDRISGKGSGMVLKGILLMAMVALMLTKSRMAFVSAFLALGFYWSYFLSTLKKIAVALVGIIALCVIGLWMGDELLSSALEASAMGRGSDAMEMTASFSGRTFLWWECVKEVSSNPIFGFGYNSFLGPKNINKISMRVGWTPNSPHSAYVDTMVGLGFVGLIVLLFILYFSYQYARRLVDEDKDYALVAAVFVWLVLNAFLEADPITRPTFPTFFCIVLMAKLAFIADPQTRWQRREVTRAGRRKDLVDFSHNNGKLGGRGLNGGLAGGRLREQRVRGDL